MCVRIAAYRAMLGALLTTSALALAGCTYERDGPPELHFTHFKAGAPVDDTVTVCSAYGCQHQTLFTFTENDIRQIAIVMDEARRDGSAEAEREAVGQAIAWIERRIGPVTGTDRDRPGLDILGSGDKGQQDCVDEATNTTSYLMVLERYDLLRHHKVVRPMAKGNMIMGTWVHWGAMIEEKATGQKYAVDSFFYKNGRPPVIMAAERWYIDEGTPQPKPRREPVYAEKPVPQPSTADRGNLNQLFDRVVSGKRRSKPAAFGYTGQR